MIDEIHVKNLALIKEATMVPSARLTVLTGETGAGKTALLSACKLLMGMRADKGVVREGADAAQVSGRLYLPMIAAGEGVGEEGEAAAAIADVAATAAAELPEEEVVVVRRLTTDGRSRVSIDGEMASVSELSKRVSPTIDLCGQHEHQTLMKSAAHGGMLDAWAGESVATARAAYAGAFEEAVRAQREYERVLEVQESSQAQLDEARFVLRTIDAVGVIEGEYEELAAFLAKTEHAESLARLTDVAYRRLSGDEGASDALNEAAGALLEAARYDAALEPYAQSLREVGYVIEDVARDVLAYRDDVEFDPQQLAEAQERYAALQRLLRSYGPRIEDVLEKRRAAADLVSLVDDADERRRAAKRVLDAAEEALAQVATCLYEARQAQAPLFAQAVTQVMGRLEMGSAELVCAVDLLPRAQWTKSGPSSIEFLFRPGAGMQARPLVKIASGGEISRVMLAIKVVLGASDQVSTLIFDEVDAGVGGATAVALAQVLADLAQTHQVIIVTHLAQVAVMADTHFVVRKSNDEMPETSLIEVSGAEREAEIARMLSGEITEASLAHARELLA